MLRDFRCALRQLVASAVETGRKTTTQISPIIAKLRPRRACSRIFILQIHKIRNRVLFVQPAVRRSCRKLRFAVQEVRHAQHYDSRNCVRPRQTYHSSHFYTDFIDGCSRYGGNLSILDLKTNRVTNLFAEDDPMTTGIFGRTCLSFDAKKLLFDWKKAPKESFRIYEVNVDGTGLRQLTFPKTSWNCNASGPT